MTVDRSVLVYSAELGRGHWVGPEEDGYPSGGSGTIVEAWPPSETAQHPEFEMVTAGDPTSGTIDVIFTRPNNAGTVPVSNIPFNATGVQLAAIIEAALFSNLARIIEVETAGGPLGTLPIAFQFVENDSWDVSETDDSNLVSGTATTTLEIPGTAIDTAEPGTIFVDTDAEEAYIQVSEDADAPTWKLIT